MADPALTAAWLEVHPAGRGAGGDLERALQALVEEGQTSLPGAAIDGPAFVRYAAARLPAGADAAAIAAVRAADLYLACACAAADPRGLAELDRRYLKNLGALLVGARVEEAALLELPQLLRERLLIGRPNAPARIADYRGKGSLASWIRVSALRLASNLRRGDDSRARVEQAQGVQQLAAADPELAVIQRRFQTDFSTAFQQGAARLEPMERNLLRLHFVDGLGVDRLAVLLSTSRASAGRRLLAAREALVAATLDELRGRLRLEGAELDSLLAVVRSKLHLSFGALLRGPGLQTE